MDEFVTARLAGAGSVTNNDPGGTVVSATDAIPATQRTGTVHDTAGRLNMRFAVPLFLVLCTLLALLLWGWSKGRTQTATLNDVDPQSWLSDMLARASPITRSPNPPTSFAELAPGPNRPGRLTVGQARSTALAD
jgi:hypothetical protein